LDDLAQIAQSVSIMKDGAIILSGLQQDVFFNENVISRTQLIPPLAVKVSKILIERGWPLEGWGATTPKRLLQAMKKVGA